jgi:hypothetical protein
VSPPPSLSLVQSNPASPSQSARDQAVPAPAPGTGSRVYIHHIDDRDVVTYVNEQWMGFAHANGAERLPLQVIGRSLWDFIARDETKSFYARAIEHVRRKGVALQIPFRGDSPSCRRHMEMRIEPTSAGEIEFRSFVIREDERQPVPLLDVDVPRADWEVLTICSVCRKALTGDRWLELEDVLRVLKPPHGDAWHRLSETVCDTCEALVALQLRAHPGERPQLCVLD